MSQSERLGPVGSRGARGTVRWGLGLSVLAHVAAVVGLLLLHHVVTPADETGSVELVMVSPAPDAPSTATPQDSSGSTETAQDREATTEQVPVLEQPAVVPTPPVVPPQPPVPQQQAIVPPQPVVPEQQSVVPPQPIVPEQDASPPPVPVPTIAPALPSPPPTPPRPVRAPRPPVRAVAQANSPVHVPPSRSQTPDAPGVTAPSAETSASASPAVPAQQAARAGADPAWLAGVSAWLLAHRSYPEMARALGRQGTVVVQITVDSAGRVLGVNLVQGSGSDALDHAAEQLVRDARLPPFPPDMKLPQQSLTVPIHYRLE